MAKKRNTNNTNSQKKTEEIVEEVKTDAEDTVVETEDTATPSDSIDVEETTEDAVHESEVDEVAVDSDSDAANESTEEVSEEVVEEEVVEESKEIEGTPADSAPKSEDLPKETIPEETKTINTATPIVATDPVAAPTSQKNASKTAKITKTYVAGQGVKLVDEPLYNIAGSAKPFKRITGVFYIYDDKCVQGRYRITDQRSKVRKGINNIIGYIDPK